MKVYADKDRAVMEDVAAGFLAQSLRAVVDKKKKAVLALCGGRSVSGIYASLAEQDVPWSSVHIFMVDERLVPLDDGQSNFRLVKESLIDALGPRLPSRNAHPFIVDTAAEDKGVSAYESDLASCCGAYDVLVLSAGEDGHVAALYPDHQSIMDPAPRFIVMDDSPKPPKERMSMSGRHVLKASAAVLVFFGESKVKAWKRFQGGVAYHACPAGLVREIGDVIVCRDGDLDG
ncbi:MAG: 6-phosphogluconolactonase [Nanoarchaeota archaeon]